MESFFRKLGAVLSFVLISAACSNPVVTEVPPPITEGPPSLELNIVLPAGLSADLISGYSAQIKEADGTVTIPKNLQPPFNFTGVIAGSYTVEASAQLADGADYFGKTETIQISGAKKASLTLIPTRALPVEFSITADTVAANTVVYLTSATPTALIRYTTDNSEPTVSSTLYSSASGITLPGSGSQTLKAAAFASGLDRSVPTQKIYTISGTVVAAPVFSPAQESFASSVDVTLSTSTSGASILYSTDGSEPSLTYSAAIPLTATTTIRAKATKAGMSASPVVEKTYTKGLTPPTAPVFSHDSGTYATAFDLTLTAQPGALIYFTTNGATPTTASNLYGAAIDIDDDMTVKAISSLSGLTSTVVTKSYVIDPAQTPSNPPQISPVSGSYQVGMEVTLTAPGATIYYTIDGTEPTEASTTYSVPFSLDTPSIITLKAKAKEGTKPLSSTASETYNIQASDSIKIYYFKEAGTPTIWMWEDGAGGRDISTLEGGVWPGPNMTVFSTGWFFYEIPSSYYPLTKTLKFMFDAGSEVTLPGPVTSSKWLKAGVWTDENPDGPTVSAAPGTSTFYTDTVQVTLSASGTTSSEYKINSGSWTAFTNGQSVYLGAGLTVGQTVTLDVRGNSGTYTAGPYVYTKGAAGSGISLYYKKSGDTAPTVWYWEGSGGRALATLKGLSWPGPAMTSVGGDWWKYDIPADLLPITLPIKVKFDAGAELTRDPPATGWWNGSAWSNENPDPPAPPSISVTPPAGWYEGASVSVTPTFTADSRAPITVKHYKINTGSWVTYTSGDISVPLAGNPGEGATTDLTVEATNTAGTTTSVYKYRKGPQPMPSFTWDNANIYFVITDRFYNGNSANDSSYGRPRTDATGKNIGTFHGGDIAGLKAKVDANYFTDLGINAIWITAPYEQAHGWCGGGSAGDFAHYAYHGYYALDFSSIDESMGTRAEFKAFVDAAHAKGIRIVMDIVMNHTGYSTIKDMVDLDYGGKKAGFSAGWTPAGGQTWHSVHDEIIDYSAGTSSVWTKFWGADWIRSGLPGFTAGGGDDLTKNLANLPDFKTETTNLVGIPGHLVGKNTYGSAYAAVYTASGTRRVRDWLVGWLSQWVREYGIDGFRVDTAKHVEMDSWLALRTASTQALTDWRAANTADPAASWVDPFWMVAEVWGHGPGQSNYHTPQGGAFDSVINFDFQSAAGKGGSGPGSASGWEGTYANFASSVNSSSSGNWNFLSYISSHDTGAVFRSGMSDDQQKRAGTMLLLAPGGVQVFYGDEYGRANGEGGSDADQGSRSSMDWTSITTQASSPTSILSHWRKVGQFRKRNIAVGAGIHDSITATGAPYAFTRVWGTTNMVVVAVDASASSVTFTDLPTVWANGTQVRDAYTGVTATVSGNAVTITGVTVGNPVLVEKVTP